MTGASIFSNISSLTAKIAYTDALKMISVPMTPINWKIFMNISNRTGCKQ